MIQLEGVSKGYGGRTLFRDVSWQIGSGERIGLVGPNGAGKTTLCRIIAGVETADAGVVSRARATTVGYLPQEVAVSSTGSVLTEALSGYEEVWRLEREMEDVAEAMASSPPGEFEGGVSPLRSPGEFEGGVSPLRSSDELTTRYGDLQHRFESLGGYRLEADARAILSGLGFSPADHTRALTEFSGGWRMRAALARLLLLRPSLLLLDEPTNHLDLESLIWLEDVLADYDGTVIVVSHDRYFLNRMVTSIADLGPAGLTTYQGDYDTYLAEREARRALREAQARNQAKRVAEIERFIERFRYKATKARQVQSRIKMLDRIERIETDADARGIRFTFPQPPRTGRRVATLRGIEKAYGDNVVYAGVDFDLERGDRVALVGPNGAGKSTLLRIIAGVLPFDAGERALGVHVTVHYYAQHQLDALDVRLTVLEELERAAPELGQTRVRTILGAFLFSGDDVDKTVAVLSGGEKARLALAKILVRPAALLALDEPTNHLDLASREVLESALAAFPGTIVFISHDRYFINRIATKVVEVERGHLSAYLGDYDNYLDAKNRARTAAAGSLTGRMAAREAPGDMAPPAMSGRGFATSRPQTSASRLPVPPAPRSDRQANRQQKSRRDSEFRKLRERLETVERQIHELEVKLQAIGEALADPDMYRDGDRVRTVTAERKTAEEQVAWLMHEWERLSSELAAHD